MAKNRNPSENFFCSSSNVTRGGTPMNNHQQRTPTLRSPMGAATTMTATPVNFTQAQVLEQQMIQFQNQKKPTNIKSNQSRQ